MQDGSPFFADFDRDAYETLKEDMAEKVDEHTSGIINISRKLALFKFFIIFLLTYPKITKYIRKSSYNISIHVKINSGKADFYLI